MLLELLDNIGGVILNGRICGDMDGAFTFSGAMGYSTVDYAISSVNLLHLVQSVNIKNKPFSDHMPLCIEIAIPHSNSDTNSITRTVQKLRWSDNKCPSYKQNLTSAKNSPQFYEDLTADLAISHLTNKIRTAYPGISNAATFTPKNKWFDWQCFRARKKMFDKLDLYRKYCLPELKTDYLESRRQFIKLVREKKMTYMNDNLMKLNYVSNSSDWWKLAKSFRSSTQMVRSNLQPDEFLQHFATLYAFEATVRPIQGPEPYVIDPILDSPIELCELERALTEAKCNKAPGQDGIPLEFYKNTPACFKLELLCILNKIFLREEIPDDFRCSLLMPIYKKGDPNSPSNHRGLSLNNTSSKVFTGILNNRLNFWMNENDILNEYQAGFRQGYSTTDNIFNLVNIIELNKVDGKCTYALFVDLKCCFDSIPRSLMFFKLTAYGLSTKFIRILRKLYTDNKSRIWDGSTLSSPFSVDRGVKQGCILSPSLFALYINDLHDSLPGGVNVADTSVKVLLYADDLVLLADKPDVLQVMINAFYAYCDTWGLTVNLEKTNVVVFRKGPRLSSNLSWKFGSENIEIKNSYKYLGIKLNYNLNFKNHLEERLSTSKIAICATWSNYLRNPKISNANKLKIFYACSRSIMFYGAQVWGYKRYEEVEKLFRFFIKKMLALPETTPNYMLLIESGLLSQFVYTLEIHFRYILTVLNLPINRLPRILATEIINKKISWANHWSELYSEYDLNSDYFEQLALQIKLPSLLEAITNKENIQLIERAKLSQFHDAYWCLDHTVPPIIFSELDTRATSLIFKARGGLLDINAKAFKKNTDGTCTVCNLNETENTFHFIAVCPLYKRIRQRYLGSAILCYDEFLEVMNGKDYSKLYLYLLESLKYRNLIINEYQ